MICSENQLYVRAVLQRNQVGTPPEQAITEKSCPSVEQTKAVRPGLCPAQRPVLVHDALLSRVDAATCTTCTEMGFCAACRLRTSGPVTVRAAAVTRGARLQVTAMRAVIQRVKSASVEVTHNMFSGHMAGPACDRTRPHKAASLHCRLKGRLYPR